MESYKKVVLGPFSSDWGPKQLCPPFSYAGEVRFGKYVYYHGIEQIPGMETLIEPMHSCLPRLQMAPVVNLGCHLVRKACTTPLWSAAAHCMRTLTLFQKRFDNTLSRTNMNPNTSVESWGLKYPCGILFRIIRESKDDI